MSHLSRRSLLGAGLSLTALGAGGLLTGCGPSGSGGERDANGPIRWWDHFLPKADLARAQFATFAEGGGPQVEYTVYNPAEQGKAVQLAKQSNQMPDVFTLAGLETAAIVLKEGNWFSPIAPASAEKIKANLPEGSLIEGIHMFDGELYSFPSGSPRTYVTMPWANKSMLEKAGIEASTEPQSYDDLRAAVKKAQDATGVPGLLLNLNFPARMAQFAHEMAMSAGFEGSGGIEFATGAYNFHHQAYLDVMEFLLSFQKDKLLLAASSTLDARQGRARWAAGDAVWFMDGPFNAGVVAKDFSAFTEQMVVTQLPTPDGRTPMVYNQPTGGDWWISKSSVLAEQSSALLELFTSEEYSTGQAEAMDAGPIKLEVVADSDALPVFKQCCAWFSEFGKIAPSPVARNAEVAKVTAKIRPVKPDLGVLIQGAFSGDVTDVPAALKQLSDASEKAREAGLAASGNTIGVDAWAFTDWKAGEDYLTRPA